MAAVAAYWYTVFFHSQAWFVCTRVEDAGTCCLPLSGGEPILGALSSSALWWKSKAGVGLALVPKSPSEPGWFALL